MVNVSVVLHAELAQPPTQELSSVPAVLQTWSSTTESVNSVNYEAVIDARIKPTVRHVRISIAPS